MGIAATHPSVADIVTVSGDSRGRVPTTRRSMALVALILPAALTLGFPSSGVTDVTVRVSLLTLLLLMVALRMTAGDAVLAETERLALRQANHDALTGLPNRAALVVRMDETLRSPAPESGLSLFLLDSDRFKQINDAWGHDVGDLFLQTLALRLSQALRETDTLYRLGGDEFVLVAPGGSEATAASIAERILEITQRPLLLPTGQVITTTTSIGLAQALPGEQTNAADLIRDADIALYTAKDRGRATWTLFDSSLRETVTRRVRLTEELGEAVARGAIVPHYQPIRGGPGFRRLTGFEALARWQRADGVSVTPNQFIPVAEDTGLIVDLGKSILREACADLARWRHDSDADLHMSVNVSP
jgi:diguanylate cyclase (GGDEF)-like protein